MAKIHNDKKRRIYRPEIVIEYNSITQIPIILLTICRFGIKKANFDFMCGEIKLGTIKVVIIPKYRFKKRDKRKTMQGVTVYQADLTWENCRL